MENPPPEHGQVALTVILPHAIALTSAMVARLDGEGTFTPSNVRGCWIRCLRTAFSAYYPQRSRSPYIAVFGGTPALDDIRGRGVGTGISKWPRWEFLHDVAVVEWEEIKAPFANIQVPIVRRALWQVESEIAGDGSKVAEDVSKLAVASGENKLLVASFTSPRRQEKWLDFLGHAMSGAPGKRFVALVPNYGNKQRLADWREPSIPILLYRVEDGGSKLIAIPLNRQLA